MLGVLSGGGAGGVGGVGGVGIVGNTNGTLGTIGGIGVVGAVITGLVPVTVTSGTVGGVGTTGVAFSSFILLSSTLTVPASGSCVPIVLITLAIVGEVGGATGLGALITILSAEPVGATGEATVGGATTGLPAAS